MIRIAFLLLMLAPAAATAADPNKVLRYAFEIAETSFDPPRISDLYSNIVNGAMFDAPYNYDYLARPAKMKPNTAVALPEISADGLTYTIRIKPGIYFNDDPAFNGTKRELTAQDYVYSMKRVLDPKLRSSQVAELEPYVVGADVAMMTSALLRHGPDFVATAEAQLRAWMDEREYDSVDQLRGSASAATAEDPAAFERANYMRTIRSWSTPPRSSGTGARD